MGDLLRFESDQGVLLVEERDGADLERIGLLDRVRPSRQRLEEALGQIRPAIDSTLKVLDGLAERPEQIEVEIGVTLTAEAGAIISRTTVEGHLLVRVLWKVPEAKTPRDDAAA